MVGIYKITSPNNKIYIGQSWCIENRLKKYEKGHCDHQRKLYSSIVKYSWKNHIFTIICELPKDVSQEVLNLYELLYFDQYKYCGFEMMNIKEPGSKGKHSEDTRNRMSENRKGKRIGKYNPMFGKGHLIKGDKHGMFGKKGLLHFSSIKVDQYHLDGTFVRSWNSFADIQRELGISASNICNVCKGKRQSTGNYKWKYKN